MAKQPSLVQDLYNFSIGKEISSNDAKYRELIRLIMLDKNYSVTKEKITCYLCNVNHNPEKHDYDGTKLIDGVEWQVEVKPTTYWGKGKAKLKMKCAFADYTMDRLNRDKQEQLLMAVSGFNGVELVYGILFDFNAAPFVGALQDYMKKKIKQGTRTGERLIPAPDINDIAKIDEVEILYPADMSIIEKNKEALHGKVYDFFAARLEHTPKQTK